MEDNLLILTKNVDRLNEAIDRLNFMLDELAHLMKVRRDPVHPTRLLTLVKSVEEGTKSSE